MKRLQKFPKEWKGVVHCSKHFEYSSSYQTEVVHTCSPFVEKSQWGGVDSLTHPDKEFGLIVPYKILEYGRELFVQLRKKGNWFVLSAPYLYSGCSSCDGETESSFNVREYEGIHDLLWNHFTDNEREELGLFLWDDEEQRYPSCLLEFQEKFPEEDISWIF
nr:hypothetical protein MarFTME_503 [Marseillevirus futianmevirus]